MSTSSQETDSNSSGVPTAEDIAFLDDSCDLDASFLQDARLDNLDFKKMTSRERFHVGL